MGGMAHRRVKGVVDASIMDHQLVQFRIGGTDSTCSTHKRYEVF